MADSLLRQAERMYAAGTLPGDAFRNALLRYKPDRLTLYDEPIGPKRPSWLNNDRHQAHRAGGDLYETYRGRLGIVYPSIDGYRAVWWQDTNEVQDLEWPTPHVWPVTVPCESVPDEGIPCRHCDPYEWIRVNAERWGQAMAARVLNGWV